MKGAVEKKNSATDKGALELDKDIVHLRELCVLEQSRKKEKTRRKKTDVAEAESLTCAEQHLSKTGVARWNLPKQQTTDTGMNALPSSQHPPASDATSA